MADPLKTIEISTRRRHHKQIDDAVYRIERLMKIALQTASSSLIGLVLFGLLLFLPTGTFNYWQAWVFIAVFAISTTVPTIYLLLKDPATLQRRMHAGPRAETRIVQKFAVSGAFLSLAAMLIVSALDHRFGWSSVPTAVSLCGDVLVALGLGIAMLVILQNRYAASNITVEAEQKVVSTGLYSLVRHPMYFGSLIMMLGIPLALDSYWGLVFVIPGLIVLVIRILDEEKALEQELDGYREYTQKVRHRLVPYIW